MAAPRRWIRLDLGWDESDWLVSLPPETRLSWIKLLIHVKRDGADGRAKALSPRAAAVLWRVSDDAVLTLLQAAKADGALIVEDGDWVVSNWPLYQKPDRTNADRQRRHRERQRDEDNTVIPMRNTVTRHVTET